MAIHPALSAPSIQPVVNASDQERLQQLRMQGGLLQACVEGIEETRRLNDQPEDPARVVQQVRQIAVDWLRKAPELFPEFQCPQNIEQLSDSELAADAAKVNDLALVKFCRNFCSVSLLSEEEHSDRVAHDLREKIQKGEITSNHFKIYHYLLREEKSFAIPLELLSLNWYPKVAGAIWQAAQNVKQPLEPFFRSSVPGFHQKRSEYLLTAIRFGNLEKVQSFRTWPNRKNLPLDLYEKALRAAFYDYNIPIFKELREWEAYQNVEISTLISWLTHSYGKEISKELVKCPRVQSFLLESNQLFKLLNGYATEKLWLYQAVASIPHRAALSSFEFIDLLYFARYEPKIFHELLTWPELERLPLCDGPQGRIRMDLKGVRGMLQEAIKHWHFPTREEIWRDKQLERLVPEAVGYFESTPEEDLKEAQELRDRKQKYLAAMTPSVQVLDDLIKQRESEALAK